MVDIALLEHCLRADLNKRSPRVMGVLRPLRVIIDNYPEGQVEEMDAVNNPEDASMGTRKVPFSREIYIEQDDFREIPPKKYHRLCPGQEVRLRYAYLVRCIARGERPEDRRSDRGALHVRSGHARRQHARRPQGEGHDPLGLGRRTRCRSRPGSTTTCSRSPIPTTCPQGQDFKVNLNPNSLERINAFRRAEPEGRRARQPLPVRAARLFLRRSRFHAREARVQPHGVAGRYVGEDREEGVRRRDWRLATPRDCGRGGLVF